MSDINPNFSCSDPDLNRNNISEDVWMIQSEGTLHENTITAIAVVLCIFVLIGLPWNFIVAASIFIKQLFREPSYILLLSLVISDLLVCGFVLPFNVASAIQQGFTIGNSDYTRCQVCQATIILIIGLIYVSLFSLALMSADRLFYIKWPFSYQRYITAKKALIMIIITWIFCLLISIPPVFGFGEIKFANSVGSCSPIIPGETKLTANIYYIAFLALVATVPFVLTVVVNIWLLVIAYKSIGSVHNTIRNNNNLRTTNTMDRRTSEQKINTGYHKKQIRLAKVFGTIFGVNITIWISTAFISTLSVALSPENVPYPVFAAVFLIFLSQPVIHPMLETCLVGKAKTALVNCLCFCCRNKKRQRQHDISLSSTGRKPSTESVLSSATVVHSP